MKKTLFTFALFASIVSIAQQPTPKKYSVTLYEEQWNAFFSILNRLKANSGNPDLTTRDLSDLHKDADSINAIFYRQIKPQYDSAHAEKPDTTKKHK